MDNIAIEIEKFADMFERNFKDILQKKGIVKTSDLKNTFRTEVSKRGDGYAITVYFNQYGRIIDQFAYRRGFKYNNKSKISKQKNKYKWWSNNFKKIFEQFISDMTENYMQETINKFFQALDFNNSIFS